MKEICGDVRLTFTQKLQYLALNIPRGFWGYLTLLKSTHVAPRFSFSEISTESPTRQLLDRVFSRVLQEAVPKKTIDVFDIGCGTGYVRDVLASYGYSGTYTGIDMVREGAYSDTHKAFSSTLIVDDVTTLKTDKKFDLVISMTVLEHVVDDTAAVVVSHTIVKPGGMQIHVVPMFPTLFLYFWHGFRQYNKRRLKMLFGKADEATAYYRVGGLASFFTHWCWITLPERILGLGTIRKRLPKLYRLSLFVSFKIDWFLPFLATAYIIVKRNK
jgi:2-polyprenyl-3-methyl-5-hydroxy-6-metoxy-1,4-benzoquinol methylase